MTNLATIFEELRRKRRYTTPDDIRNVFGDYHNGLHWLALFLIGDEKIAEACVIDACRIAQTQTPIFHEWLIQWAALATLRSALLRLHARVAELAPEYENGEPGDAQRPPLLAEHFRTLIKHSEEIHGRLDVLCRFVLVMRGIAKESLDEVAAKLGISRTAVERAYCVAYDALAKGVLCVCS